MLLYFVRHAQSEGNAKVPGAPIDCHLTEMGYRQAEAAGERLASLGIDRVMASPYTRALETADAIRRAASAPAGVVPLLHEHHVHPFPPAEGDDWPLLSRTLLAERFPEFELPADFEFAPKWHNPPETEDSVFERAGRVLRELWERYAIGPGGNENVQLALVSHGSPTGKLVMAAMGLESPHGKAVRIDNASISIVEYFPDWRVLVASNQTDHLAHLKVDFRAQDPGYPNRRQSA
jgi:glucosyl-3-phosphoglycerate phosphatase